MKKFLSAVLVSLFAVVAFPLAVSAQSADPVTLVTGTVSAGGNPVSAANVTVNCGSVSGNDTTDSDGGYVVQFAAADCPNGATATASASKNGASGSNSATANKVSTKLNIALVDVNVALPEMGTIISGVAAVGAGGAFLVIRRKQQISSEVN